MKIKGKKGFTLIEMLIVVAIIGLLATVVLFAVARARKKAVATQMKAHAVEIMKGMEMAATDGVTSVDVVHSTSLTNADGSVVYIKNVPTRPNDQCGYLATGTAGGCNSAPTADTNFNASGLSTSSYEICVGGFATGTGHFKCIGGSCWCSVAGGCLATP